MSSVNGNFYFFLICMSSIFLHFITALSSKMLNRSGKSRFCSLHLILERRHPAISQSVWCCLKVFHRSSLPGWSNSILFLVCWSPSVEMIRWLLFFILWLWCKALIDLQMLKQPPVEQNATWSWNIALFIGCWIQFASFYEQFCTYIYEEYWSVFFLLSFCMVSASGWL